MVTMLRSVADDIEDRSQELAVGPVNSTASKAILSLAGAFPPPSPCAGSSPASHPARYSWT
ncbi:MAG TPA: hypothetical protein VHM23_14030 [Actinomycetota bacterium]|nr:hypothetical protein [Actinomycetota bacterium]